jgi:hypothetical protein
LCRPGVWNGSTNIVRLGSIPKSASGQVVFVLLFLMLAYINNRADVAQSASDAVLIRPAEMFASITYCS